jgi:hypothetical protein
MATLSALCLDPPRFPLLCLFSSALDGSRILPWFGPASSSGALTPLIFIMAIALFVMIVNSLLALVH